MSNKKNRISLDIQEEKIETVIEPVEGTEGIVQGPLESTDEIEEINNVNEIEQPVEPSEEPVEKEDKKVEDVKPVEEIVEEKPKASKKEVVKSNIDYEGRGFSSLDEAKNFVKTDYFKGLGKEDREEYLTWLNS